MTIHTVIESLAAFESVRIADPGGEREWWTTSTAVVDELTRRGETCRSMEADILFPLSDSLAIAGYTLADSLRDRLNELCPWRGYADIGLGVAALISRCFFTTLYKSWLLWEVAEHAQKKGERVECVGDPSAIGQTGLTLSYGRFDTVFSLIAERASFENLGVVIQKLDGEELARRHQAVVQRRMGRAEKMLSIISNTPSSFLFKIWKRIRKIKWFPFKQIRLIPIAKRHFYINGGNELIDEIFLEVLRQGGSVDLLPELPVIGSGIGLENAMPDEGIVKSIVISEVESAFRGAGIPESPVAVAGIDIICGRLIVLLNRIYSSLASLTAGFETIVERIAPDAWILSHGMASVEEKFFYDFCRARAITVVAFEHGLTLGLSEWTDVSRCYFAMRHADVGFYNSKLGAEEMANVVPRQRRVVAGMPKAMIGLGLRSLRRSFARRYLKVEQSEHVVMYVAELEKNNYIYGPGIDNDLQYFNKTVDMTVALCEALPNSVILLKLYPTERYLDSQSFADLTSRFRNLRITKDFDFRFMALAADLIVTTSTQSTLGWAIGSGIPCLFADFDWAPSKMSGFKMRCESLRGVKSLMIPDTSNFIRPIQLDVVSHLFEVADKNIYVK